MILDRYIFKELLKSQVIILLVLIAIFAAQSLIRLITDAASGEVPVALVLQFLILAMPEFLSLLLPLTLYIALIITLGRICSDSEMVVMRSVGFSPKRIMMIALTLAFISAGVVAYISLIVTPQAALASYELQIKASQNPEFLPIDSGRFVSFGRYNIYVEDVKGLNNNDKQVNNVFVIDSTEQDALSITVARKGHIVVDEEGIRWLVLNDGRRYENPKDGSFRIGSFESFEAPLSGNVTEASTGLNKLSTRSSYELFMSNDVKSQVELQWRISPIFAVIVMCMVAVPLAMVNPRQGRFTRLMPAIIIYIAYYLFLLSLRNMCITGEVPMYLGLYLVPLTFFILVAIPLNMPKTYLKHIRHRKQSKKSLNTASAHKNIAEHQAYNQQDSQVYKQHKSQAYAQNAQVNLQKSLSIKDNDGSRKLNDLNESSNKRSLYNVDELNKNSGHIELVTSSDNLHLEKSKSNAPHIKDGD